MDSSPSALLFPYTSNGTEEEEEEEEEEKDIIFCSKDNEIEAAIFINQELEVMGIGTILTEDEADIIKLLNTTYELIQQYKSSLHRIDNINTSLQRTRSDLTLQNETSARLKSKVELMEKNLGQLEEKQRQLVMRNKSLSGQLKVEQEECVKLRCRMSHKEQQYLHDVKKREREYQRLNDRLGQLVLDKSHERKLSIKMLNNLQTQRSKQDVVSRDDTMYKLVIAHYEEKQKELMLENTSLRDSLYNMEREIVALLNQGTPQKFVDSDKENVSPMEDIKQQNEDLLSNSHYRMPFDIVKQDIEANLREKYQRLREHISNLQEYTIEPLDLQLKREKYENEIEELEKKLSDYRDIISQQETMLEQQLSEGKAEAAFLHINESHYIKRVELLELREDKTRHREEHIRQEENRLNRLAKQLDRERLDFEEKKMQFLKQQLESSMFATPTKSSTSHMDSFFAGLSSTPFLYSSKKAQPISVLRNKPSAAGTNYFTPFKSKGPSVHNDIVQDDISLTSDDGQIEVLND